ncbi:MAG: phosphocholine cytidylyltransferase family protein [Chloroflexi bacterium]|nr:phosphocholine cytidylyltransferase family protein [Chloroflexota bacterium]
MKVIIVAAGPGRRLRPETNGQPKCLLEVGGKTILQRMLEVLRECGCDDIVVVRGHFKEMIDYPDIRYCDNPEYERNNILKSLFYAEGEMEGGFLFSYSDIIYQREPVEKLLQSQADISLVADTDWIPHYQGRHQHPLEEAELVAVQGSRVVKVGKRIISPTEAHGEFIGLARFTERGAQILRSRYHRALRQGGPFGHASSLEKAYMTDMFQDLADAGYVVQPVDIRGGWIEIDTPQDLAEARKRLTSNS